MRQREHRRPAHVLDRDLLAAVPRGEGRGGLRGDKIAAQTVNGERRAHRHDPIEHGIRESHRSEPLTGHPDSLTECRVRLTVGRREPVRVLLVRELAPDHLGPLGWIGVSPHLDGDPEAVEELRAKLSLLGVHRPDEDEPRCVLDAHTLPLDAVDPERRGVEEDVDDVITQQVRLVEVQDAAVGGRQQPRLEHPTTVGQRAFEIEGARHTVTCRTNGQLDERYLAADGSRAVVRPGRAAGVRPTRIAVERAPVDHVDLRKEAGQAADRRRLRRPLLAPDQDAAHRR